MKKIGFLLAMLTTTVFYSCGPRQLSEEEISDYTRQGQEISMETFKTLSGTLQEKMQEGGPALALDYCNTNAYPLTESMSEKYDVTIKRTALYYRNPANKPSAQEESVLNDYQKMMNEGQTPEAVVKVNDDDQAVYYAPIVLAPACVKCHGEPDVEIQPEVYDKILHLYPEDKATGFAAGDLRGIWSITFKK